NKIFADDYAKAEKKFPEAVPLEEVEKAFREWKEAQKGKDSADKDDENYAKKIGVEKNDLQNYRKIAESLQKIINQETDMSLMEELRNLFARIISKRLKKAQAPKYPVEEGDELVDPAQLVADVKSGNLQPKVWEDTEIKEKKGDRFGEVEITAVFDRSTSMKVGEKSAEQRKSAVLIMEVLKEFAELCEAEKMNIDKPLEIKSEIYSFASNESEDKKPLKKMSADLGEAERIMVLKKLYDLQGSTTDFACLEAIDSGLDEKTKEKIKAGELKKIVIVFTDGESDNPTKTQAVLKSLRENGVVAIGVGMTKDGKPVESTYAPKGLLVEDVTKLSIVLGGLLKEHLKDL
ncbi:MAG: VWA domain-containing protein, partial [Patescibacteria group bacterium]